MKTKSNISTHRSVNTSFPCYPRGANTPVSAHSSQSRAVATWCFSSWRLITQLYPPGMVGSPIALLMPIHCSHAAPWGNTLLPSSLPQCLHPTLLQHCCSSNPASLPVLCQSMLVHLCPLTDHGGLRPQCFSPLRMVKETLLCCCSLVHLQYRQDFATASPLLLFSLLSSREMLLNSFSLSNTGIAAARSLLPVSNPCQAFL